MESFINVAFNFRGTSYSFNDVCNITRGIRLLFLCSGLLRDGDVSDCCRQIGMTASCMDIEIDPKFHDLLDQTNFDRVMAEVKAAKFDCILSSPPCSTFSAARKYD